MEMWLNHEAYTIIIRILAAAFLAGLIGIEREYKRHPAGFRTHLLVGTGACLVMVMALFGFQEYMHANEEIVRYDPSRLASYVVSGVGFLGAGTIIVQGVSIKGLTTAASIWVVAAIGLAAGAGMFFAAVFTTIVVLLSLFFLNNVDRFFRSTARPEKMEIIVEQEKAVLSKIIEALEDNDISVKKVVGSRDEGKENTFAYHLHVQSPNALKRAQLHEKILLMDGVKEIKMQMEAE
ncbi:putative Mg2+ transporter-C (MgtC) family protein [Alteribacillus persepolensis]|uniref:Putative Mg2+ transporter-C (MgtC) family protein n=1 Tax=Alteribacillus persepolensis TaxID=568899 RepID=A0A1G8HGV2_9BACI|nr:MgtC/SapB family protein [Alteribacillus persepolensis]SDI05888.1 putative Mg2+ transporter-C (MgtC) family protein [Alteribacillus persepolensis]